MRIFHPQGPLHLPGEWGIVKGESPSQIPRLRGNLGVGRRFVLLALSRHLLGGGHGAARQIATWWQEVEVATRSGRLPRARRFLRWILACCPEDEEAWLWLARLASSHEAQLIYLRQAYSFHPDSVRVQAALRRARSRQLELAVGDLRTGRSVLRCLPDDRHSGNGGLSGQGKTRGNGSNDGPQAHAPGAGSPGHPLTCAWQAPTG